MANSKYFETTLTNKNEMYNAWWGRGFGWGYNSIHS